MRIILEPEQISYALANCSTEEFGRVMFEFSHQVHIRANNCGLKPEEILDRYRSECVDQFDEDELGALRLLFTPYQED